MTILNILTFILAFFVSEYSFNPCVKFDFENAYACPMFYADDGGFAVSISDLNEVKINCRKLQRFRMDLLPNITIPKMKLLIVRKCPLPEPGFKNILEAFSTEDIREIEYEYRRPKDQNITKHHFKGLEKLKYLTLANDEYEDLDEDLFENTPNLIGVELMENELRELKPNLFKRLEVLEFLDISVNKLGNLNSEVFRPLKKLEVLNLFDNNLTNVDNLFRGLFNLRQLRLDGNGVKNISETAFEDLENLEFLNLGENRLRSIPPNLLKNNTKLQIIKLYGNLQLQLVDYMFSNFTFLVEIDLSMCDLTEVPEHIFENSLQIKQISLDGNLIEKLPEAIFKNLISLEEISLVDNRIKTVDNLLTTLTRLKRLSLDFNNIEAIGEKTFAGLISLEELSLQSNEIEHIHPNAFVNNDLLQKIDLSENAYSGGGDIFKDVPNLREVNLSQNKIFQIETVSLFNKPKLKSLDLRYNSIKNVSLLDLQGVSNLNIYLDHNDISIVDFTNVDIISGNHTSVIYLANNPLRCDCHNYDLARFFNNQLSEKVKNMFKIPSKDLTCELPPELKNARFREIPISSLHCPLEHLSKDLTGCPEECSCFWKPSNQTIFVDCSSRNLTEFPEIEASYFPVDFKEIEVDLRNNSLVVMNLTSYDNVTNIFLSHNKLVTVDAIPKDLKVLHLDHNQLKSLSPQLLKDLNTSSLVQLLLGNNSWECVCGTHQMSSFLRQKSKQIDFQDIFCHNTTTRLIDLSTKDLCQDFIHISITLTISAFLVVALTTVFYYRHQKQIKIWLYARNCCLWWVTEEELDKDRPYDAFISYSHEDENFVSEVLVTGLEKGPVPYNLCLHYREWIPGEFIITHILNSVEKSKRTIIVLSKNFLKSTWGKAEFQQAHSEAMAEGRARVIVILYEEVNSEMMDDDMKAYFKTNTYLEWKDPYFWDKLRYALPHRKR